MKNDHFEWNGKRPLLRESRKAVFDLTKNMKP